MNLDTQMDTESKLQLAIIAIKELKVSVVELQSLDDQGQQVEHHLLKRIETLESELKTLKTAKTSEAEASKSNKLSEFLRKLVKHD